MSVLASGAEKSAGIAQLVEHNLAKVGVAGSSPVSRSGMGDGSDAVRPPFSIGAVAKLVRQRTANPLSPVRIWVAPPDILKGIPSGIPFFISVC